jgi:hypothetical protein
MKKNIGNADLIVRLLLAALAAFLYFTNVVTGTLGIVILIIGGILILTSLCWNLSVIYVGWLKFLRYKEIANGV